MNDYLYNVRIGFYSAVLICCIMLLAFITGLYKFPAARTLFYFGRELGIAGMLIMLSAILFTDYHSRSRLNFKVALQNGLLITIIIAITGALFLYLYIAYIHPSYKPFILEYRLRFANTPEEVAFIKETNYRKFIPTHLMASGFTGLMFQGVVLSLLTAFASRFFVVSRLKRVY